MLRMPKLEVAHPRTAEEAVALAAEHGEDAMFLAGGTDLNPNLKHGLFEPKVLIALGGVEELRGVRAEDDGTLVIGAMTTLTEVHGHEDVLARAPAVAQAARLVSGPQLRNMGTLGGNVMLDTRCQWYNQTYFWRKSLGFCMKKDGTVCHVVKGGSKCVAAASNDTAPALMTLEAELVYRTADGERRVPIRDLWQADGIWNKKVAPGELLTEIRVPPAPEGHRGAYGKLRDRGSIDFPLFGIAVRLDLDGDGKVAGASLAAVALQAKPWLLRKVEEPLLGTTPGEADFEEAVEAVAAVAAKQCRPMPNVPGDHEYRHAMVPVYVRRTLHAAARGDGPVHHV